MHGVRISCKQQASLYQLYSYILVLCEIDTKRHVSKWYSKNVEKDSNINKSNGILCALTLFHSFQIEKKSQQHFLWSRA